MTIWLFPIESLEQRYSAQWAEWFPAELMRLGYTVCVVNGEVITNGIEDGQFLDVVGTNYYKATQLARFVACLHAGEVRDGDTVLLLDAWNHEVFSLAYMRDLLGKRLQIAGLLHAGSYDPTDFLGQCPQLVRWAEYAERGFAAAYDHLFVATDFHRKFFMERRGGAPVVTGFPLYAEDWKHHALPWGSRSRTVVWPHRITSEKAPEVFDAVRSAYVDRYGQDGTTWVRTKDLRLSKQDYYALIGASRCVLSTALHEMWGIGVLEGASLGCYPVTPARLSYPEIYGADQCYHTVDQAAEMVYAALESRQPYRYSGARWENAIENMACYLGAP